MDYEILGNSFICTQDEFNRLNALLHEDIQNIMKLKKEEKIINEEKQNYLFILEYLIRLIETSAEYFIVEDRILYEIPCSEQTKLRLISFLLKHI